MRIGICGAESTGKTTLAKALAEELGLPLITEQARTVAQEMGITDLNREYPKELWDRFQWRCLEAQMAAELRHKDFVSDRTVLDNLAYWLVDHATPENCWDTLEYWDRVEYHLGDISSTVYDLIVFVRPTDTKLEFDGFRHRDLNHQLLIDRVLWSLITWADSISTTLFVWVRGTTEDRVRQVMEAMKRLEGTGEIANAG